MTGRAASALARIGIVCADLDRTARFYAGLGFEATERRAETDPGWHALWGTTGRTAEILSMRLGAQAVDFVRFDPPGAAYPAGSTATDLWFQHLALVVADMGAAYARLQALPFTAISRDGPQRLPPSTGRVEAFKFRDPDGHPLELLHLPPHVGDARWQHAGPALFRGIDHSAIAVRDAGTATAFYERTLGLTRGAATVNQGPAQERLDDVERVVVDVVPLAPGPAPTPHVELLAYRTGTRRPQPPGAGPADIAATRLVFHGAGTGEPPGSAARWGEPGAGHDASAFHDPDGHRLIVL